MRIHGALLLVVVLGCGPGKKSDTVGAAPVAPDAAVAAPAADIPAELVTLVEAELAVLDKIAAAAAQAGQDCNAIAASLVAIAEGPDGEAMGKTARHLEYPAHESAIQTRYAERIDGALGTLLAAVSPCADHAGVDEAMTRLGF
jgi:hypothetical protein